MLTKGAYEELLGVSFTCLYHCLYLQAANPNYQMHKIYFIDTLARHS